ncbi:(2Fe-2S)-binding protein [Flagellimonas allohymeniacidonis]|uniref:(2Fe-2S)-binding protein n=1 Tax=Flagellimonas allohymeniacidonis TaxID=2517819 RepID=A0A4Q8QIB2_9FLAO|nr:(2Fe-2S)-binding protein [Allomuricauda hymeniacidonis]TAI49587.1 (2Fe-2S)-binding protein [Allomuricauda hymeniacidonis]
MKVNINGQDYEQELDPDMPVLWVLRDVLGLTATKYGCGIGQCGACTVLVDGQAMRSCTTKVRFVEDKQVQTIEGVSREFLHPVQKAWIDEQVPQCGYCQSGQIMSAIALLNENPEPTDGEIKSFMSGNICRCGTYPRIIKAIRKAAQND